MVGPSFVARLLLGVEPTGVANLVARVAGIGLFSLGVACWPWRSTSWALCGMLTYNSLATLGLLYLALNGKWDGPLLWPAVVLHAVLTLLLARSWFKSREDKPT